MLIGDPYTTVEAAQRFIRLFNGGYYNNMTRGKTKIIWHRLPGYKLKATWNPGPRGFEYGIREEDMVPIQEWCEKNNCGVRTSFDTWKFKKPEDMTFFLLKWE